MGLWVLIRTYHCAFALGSNWARTAHRKCGVLRIAAPPAAIIQTHAYWQVLQPCALVLKGCGPAAAPALAAQDFLRGHLARAQCAGRHPHAARPSLLWYEHASTCQCTCRLQGRRHRATCMNATTVRATQGAGTHNIIYEVRYLKTRVVSQSHVCNLPTRVLWIYTTASIPMSSSVSRMYRNRCRSDPRVCLSDLGTQWVATQAAALASICGRGLGRSSGNLDSLPGSPTHLRFPFVGKAHQ